MKSTYHITVRGYELDSFGHLNNAVYLNYAEQAKWEFLNDNKLLEIVNQYGLFPVILENNIRYMHEFKLLDKVRIETEWICTHKILHFKHIFFNDKTEVKSCTISGKLMFADSNRMVSDIPDEIYNFMQEDLN
ncbi:MAG: acyl-CoA thioesterase [Oscillospiraceae bacterium]|nr:acyl-CoA thioesterase [Oscillospiraceae bacterium]